MNKRKIALLAMSACMIAILAIGGTLAYFTDTDAQLNTFTVGNVAIDLFEDFGDNKDNVEHLVPSTMVRDDKGNVPNGIEKEVYVRNTGSEPAWVRVHIAIPTILDDGDPTYNAMKNTLHWNMPKESMSKTLWNWTKNKDEADGYDAENWNAYKTSIDGIGYNVYVATYGSQLQTNDVTKDAISQVYLDAKVTNEQITNINKTLNGNWKIYVVAEGGQADENFDNAYDALNAQFGTPGATGYVAPDFLAAPEGSFYEETKGSKGVL